MNPGLVYDHDALPETCRRDGHVPGCPGMAGGDHELWTGPLPPVTPQVRVSYLRCSTCGSLLDGLPNCPTCGEVIE